MIRFLPPRMMHSRAPAPHVPRDRDALPVERRKQVHQKLCEGFRRAHDSGLLAIMH